MDTPARATTRQKTVLVVDDNPFVRSQLRELFLSDSFTACTEAANGKEAMAEALRCTPDVIILDLSMPVMNGIEAAPQLREMLPNTPIILFTLYGGDVPAEEVRKLGITAVVPKTNIIDLLQEVHRLLVECDSLQGGAG